MSIQECKKILNKNGIKYTNEAVKNIREIVEKFAYLECALSEHIKEGK